MVRLPNGATTESSHTAELDIPELNAAASTSHVFPGMANHSLLSVGQLYDEGYIVTFKQAEVRFRKLPNFERPSRFEHRHLAYQFEAN
jgi:hypothetical protein